MKIAQLTAERDSQQQQMKQLRQTVDKMETNLKTAQDTNSKQLAKLNVRSLASRCSLFAEPLRNRRRISL